MNNRIRIEAQAIRGHVERLRLEYPELDDDLDLLTDTIEGETDFFELMARLVNDEREANAMADAIKAREAALSDRRGRYERQKDAIRSLMHGMMDAAGQTKVTLPEATVSIGKGTARVIVTDDEAVPDELCTIVRIPSRAAIKDAFAAGRTVPGAALSSAQPRLTVRAK